MNRKKNWKKEYRVEFLVSSLLTNPQKGDCSEAASLLMELFYDVRRLEREVMAARTTPEITLVNGGFECSCGHRYHGPDFRSAIQAHADEHAFLAQPLTPKELTAARASCKQIIEDLSVEPTP